MAPTAQEPAMENSPAKGEVVADGPRAGALSWDEYFMSVAFLTAMRSKDPLTQVGACIVNELHRIIGVGYNGFPGGVDEGKLPWARESAEGELATKYPYVVHAELNAVLNKNAESCRGSSLYSTLFPCNECAKVIIQSGVREVIYASDKHHGRTSSRAARRLFALAGVKLRHFSPKAPRLCLSLRYPEDEPLPEPLDECLECELSPGRQGCVCCSDDSARKMLGDAFAKEASSTRAAARRELARPLLAVAAVPLACGLALLLARLARGR